MHNTIAIVLELSSKKIFDPHMTLINTLNQNYKQEVAQLSRFYIPITDLFVLALGISDDIGQFIEIKLTLRD
ncbi:MAG TPA: hypothetical protein VHZ76_07535 [Gammaproteobacteria bacterium]|jgi:hypothetical protein|nr:hypothetical protein [Gammaproteobacteria bacterium]